jgi:hypothetical protein
VHAKAFEPELERLFDCAFDRTLRGLASVGIRAGAVWHTPAVKVFQAACLPDFKTSQKLIGGSILSLADKLANLREEERRARVSGDPFLANILGLRQTFENRQLALRRLMDGLLWVLIWPHRWILKRVRVELGIRSIDRTTLRPILEAANKQNDTLSPDTFLLVSDLTTIVQLGDLVIAKWIPSRNSMKVTFGEIKYGSHNVLLWKRLHAEIPADEKSRVGSIEREFGPKSAKQAERMLRQERRLRDFNQLIKTDEGRDPMNGRRFRMTRDTIVSRDYLDELSGLVSAAKVEGSCGMTIDGCLHFYATKAQERSIEFGALVAHNFLHARVGRRCTIEDPATPERDAILAAPKAVDLVKFVMSSPLGMPPFLWYPKDLMFDLVMERIRVFVQFDYERFFQSARRRGVVMRFVQGREARRLKPLKLSAPLIEFADDRFVRVELPQDRGMIFGARFFAGIYWALERPCDLIFGLKAIVSQAIQDNAWASEVREGGSGTG